MDIKDKVLSLINTNLKMCFIENGCGGNPIAANIFKQPNSSNIIHHTMCLYNEEFNRKYFKIDQNIVPRAISEDFVYEVARSYKIPILNYVVATSFVLNSYTEEAINNDAKIKANHKSTHGYIAINNKVTKVTKVYHISLHHGDNRENNIKKIGDICITLLYDEVYNKISNDIDCFIDNITIYKNNEKKQDVSTMLNYMSHQSSDHVILFDANDTNKYRLEDLIRPLKKIVILKGSFNPLQYGHIELMETVKAHSNTEKGVFAISIDNRDKDSIDIKELISRINQIKLMGYDVLLFKNKYYTDNNDLILNKFPDLQIYYAIGADTMQRLLDDCGDRKWTQLYRKSVFVYLPRTNFNVSQNMINAKCYYDVIKLEGNKNIDLSSTTVRNLIDELKKLVPLEVLKKYFENI